MMNANKKDEKYTVTIAVVKDIPLTIYHLKVLKNSL